MSRLCILAQGVSLCHSVQARPLSFSFLLCRIGKTTHFLKKDAMQIKCGNKHKSQCIKWHSYFWSCLEDLIKSVALFCNPTEQKRGNCLPDSFVLKNPELEGWGREHWELPCPSNTLLSKPAEEEWGKGAKAIIEPNQIPSKWQCFQSH